MNRLQIPFILSTAGGEPAIALSQQGPRRFRKDAIRVGRFIARNPIDGGDLALEVTPERMQRWVAAFAQMQTAGVKVDLTVDHKRGAEAKRGEVAAMAIEGDRLMFEAEAADDESVTLLERCPEVSVEIEPDARDGEGRRYGEAITAISVCRKPVVPGQQPFTRIAASRETKNPAGDGTGPGIALWFSANPSDVDPNRHSPGGPGMFSSEQISQIRDLIGAKPEEVPDDKLGDKLVESLQSGKTTLADVQEKVTKLSRERDELQGKVAAGKPVELSRDVQGVLEEAVDTRLQTMVEKHQMSPAAAKKLGESLKKGGAVLLSRESNGGEKSRAMELLDALAENKPAELAKLAGERSGAQVIALSREVAGKAGEADDWVDEEVKAANEAHAAAK